MTTSNTVFSSPQRWSKAISSACLITLFVGCSQGPRGVKAPGMNPGRAGSAAIEQYDTDGDGLIGGDELVKASGVNAAMKNVDTDGDGKASADEIAERIRHWQDSGVGVAPMSCRVTMNGRPLEGAIVTFEPESFLGDNIQSATGTSTRVGVVSLTIPKANRPSPDTPPGLALGLYKVRVSKISGGNESIPAKYNTETILGQEVSDDDRALINGTVAFKLTTK